MCKPSHHVAVTYSNASRVLMNSAALSSSPIRFPENEGPLCCGKAFHLEVNYSNSLWRKIHHCRLLLFHSDVP